MLPIDRRSTIFQRRYLTIITFFSWFNVYKWNYNFLTRLLLKTITVSIISDLTLNILVPWPRHGWQSIEQSHTFGSIMCDLCRWLEMSVTVWPSMNRGRVTKRQLDRDILSKRGLGRPSILNDLAASTNPPLFSWLFESICSASPFTAPSYCPFSLSLSLSLSLSHTHSLTHSPPTLFIFFFFSLTYTHTCSHFLFPLLSTVLPRCLTLFEKPSRKLRWSVYSICALSRTN